MGLGLSIVCLSPAAAASAKGGSGLSLTVAARVCPTYEDISANLARNNIMESLRDLGPDTPYRPGEPVNPVVEERSQPECRALPGWRFTLGDSYITRAVSGPWGSLSIVRNPLPRSIIGATKSSPARRSGIAHRQVD